MFSKKKKTKKQWLAYAFSNYARTSKFNVLSKGRLPSSVPVLDVDDLGYSGIYYCMQNKFGHSNDENKQSGFPTRYVTNRPVQPQKRVRSLKFQIKEEG